MKTLILILLLGLGSRSRSNIVEVDSVLINHVYADGVHVLEQAVFMDKEGNSLGFYSIYDNNFSHHIIGKMMFLRSCNKVVKYRKLFPERHTSYDYEVKIRKKGIDRLVP